MRFARRLTAALAVLVLAAGPAIAQGTLKPAGKRTSWTPAAPGPKPRPHETPYAPLPAKPPPAKARPSDPAQPPAFKPYEPWKSTSVFGPDGKKK